MNPNFLDNISAMSKEFHGKYKRNLVMTSGYRSTEYQAALYKDAQAKYGENARSYVAPPGNSLHEKGIAADINYSASGKKDIDLADDTGLLAKYSLYRPLKNARSKEHWHIEPIGSRTGSNTENKNMSGDGKNDPSKKPSSGAIVAAKQEKKEVKKNNTPKTIDKTNASKETKQNLKSVDGVKVVKKPKEFACPTPEVTNTVSDKSNKEEMVNKNSKSLAQGTKSREVESSQSKDTGAKIININNTNPVEKQSFSANQLFKGGKING